MAIARNLTITDRPENKRLFRDLSGWRFDQGEWRRPESSNREVRLPSIDLLDLSSLDQTLYRSGIGSGGDLDLEEVRFENYRHLTGWTPGVRRGRYFVYSNDSFLHGSESILYVVGDDITNATENRSRVDLHRQPHLSLPVIAEYLERNTNNLAIKPSTIFSQVSYFTGIRINGIEQDGDQVDQTDTTKNEFKIEQNEDEPIQDLEITLTAIEVDTYQISLDTAPVQWYRVRFSHPNIFKTELTFSSFMSKQAAGTLSEGDYAVGYHNTWASSQGIRVYLENTHVNYGTVSYKPAPSATLVFNQHVQVDRTKTIEFIAGESTYYLDHFPVLDLSVYQDGALAGDLLLDTESLTITISGAGWTRVQDLTDAGVADDDKVFELDPLWGTITFGKAGEDGVHGAIPDDDPVVTYKQVPLVRYDTETSNNLFFDSREDLDPQVNALKHGFLVLDTKRLIPHKITLTALGPANRNDDDSCWWGPLSIPATSIDDMLTLRARVTARGNPPIPVPNVPVEFISLDGLIAFSQSGAVTDGDGYAYTEAFGKGHFSEYVTAVWLYEAMPAGSDPHLNPHPGQLVPHIPEWGLHIVGGDTLVIPEELDANTTGVYLLINSIPSDGGGYVDYNGDPLVASSYPTPYNGITRKHGITVVWTEPEGGAEKVMHPILIEPGPQPGTTSMQFASDIPTGHLIVAYKVVIDRTTYVLAKTAENPILTSNQVEIRLELDETMKGQWTLPILGPPDWDGFTDIVPLSEDLDASRISTATYISPNDFSIDHIELTAGGVINSAAVGTSIDLIGANIPTQEELALSVFIVKLNNNKEIIAVKNITDDSAIIDSNTIRIASLPEPPTAEYNINYWIAVGGLAPEDSNGDRQTAALLEILEA